MLDDRIVHLQLGAVPFPQSLGDLVKLKPSNLKQARRIERIVRNRRHPAQECLFKRFDQLLSDRRKQLFGELERERDKLSSEVENLRSFEREYRSRLKSYFSQQLEALNNTVEASQSVPNTEPPAAPKRLRSILGEDEG